MTRALSIAQRARRVLGPVGFWKFDEGTGTAVNDSSGNNNVGVASSGVSRVAGKYGGAASFASLAKVDIAHHPKLNLHGNFTISVWAKSTQAAASGNFPIIFRKRSSSPSYGFELVFHEDTSAPWYLSLIVNDVEHIVRATSDAADGNWHHLLVTRRGDILNAYHDGTSQGTKTAVFTPVSNTSALTFGNGDLAGLSYIGDLDHARFYNRVLSQNEITALANE